MADSKYRMRISLNVLNHLGLNLYSNIPSVLSEAIANAWDADATRVQIFLDKEAKEITVIDNGVGMDLDDINEKYLIVGYQKRGNQPAFRTPGGRKPMGRKGIGKLSLFSIANKIFVYSQKNDSEKESFLMDAEKIKEKIDEENPASSGIYEPEQVKFSVDLNDHGTVVKITDLKADRLTQLTADSLRKRIARRFGIIDDPLGSFEISVNEKIVSLVERDYFHKARFLFQYGDHDYAQHCAKLDLDESNKKMVFKRNHQFNNSGELTEDGEFAIGGWIAIARHSNDLDDRQLDDNLNKITIVVRGKVAQEDILQEFRLGGMITKYIFGEVHADFLDEDGKEDIATSSRQKFNENDPRYIAVKQFVGNELRDIWAQTNSLKEKQGVKEALSSNDFVKEWYENLRPRKLRKSAEKIFGLIDQAGVDESLKSEFYANGVLAFERLKMDYATNLLQFIDANNFKEFIEYLSNVDVMEANAYYEIVSERLRIIEKIKEDVDKDVKERVLQDYIFDHLWLLDPAWERATEYKHIEERIEAAIEATKSTERGTGKGKPIRVDIRYRRVGGAHVIIELKRPSRSLSKLDIESQLRRYRRAVKKEIAKSEASTFPIKSVCILGKLPQSWDDPTTRKEDEESLKPLGIQVMTYDELIDNAYSAYSKFVKAIEPVNELKALIENIRSHNKEET